MTDRPPSAAHHSSLIPDHSFSVRVPATSANLGPGFDALGLALDLANVVRVESMAGGGAATVEVHVEGEGAGSLASGADNLVYRSLARVAERLGVPPPSVRLRCLNAIPLARGLGSSSAAIVAGLVAGNRLLGERLSTAELLALAVMIEGHPDNVTPALLGGVRVCVQGEAGLLQTASPLARPLRAVLFVPDFPMSTEAARRLLPTAVPLADAIYNLGRAALLVAGLATGDYGVLAEATRDRLHQPPRSALFPAMPAFFAAALEAGARGAFLSGAGSTLLALVEPGPAQQAVVAAFQATAAREQVGGRCLVAAIGVEGAQVLP
jgi:homoserine kinase